MTHPQQQTGVGHPYQLWYLPAVGQSQYWVSQLVPAPGPQQNARTYSQYIRPIVMRGSIALPVLLIEIVVQLVVTFSTSTYQNGHSVVGNLGALLIPLTLIAMVLISVSMFMASKARENPVTAPLLGAAFGGVADIIVTLLLITSLFTIFPLNFSAISVFGTVIWIAPAVLLSGSYRRIAKPVMIPGYITNWQFTKTAKSRRL